MDDPFYNDLCNCESNGGKNGAHRDRCPTAIAQHRELLLNRINEWRQHPAIILEDNGSVAIRMELIEGRDNDRIRQYRERTHRAEERYDDLENDIRNLIASVQEGSRKFMEDFEKAGEGISTRMSGETAALLIEQRAYFTSLLRSLLVPVDERGEQYAGAPTKP